MFELKVKVEGGRASPGSEDMQTQCSCFQLQRDVKGKAMRLTESAPLKSGGRRVSGDFLLVKSGAGCTNAHGSKQGRTVVPTC